SCPECKSKNIEQDPDVLDTWFSSWLWPFSALGWEKVNDSTPDLEKYYPTTALITAYDIIFFWVARMIMAGLEFTGKAPFRDIYIHSLVRDKQGRKMSKSLGNGLDPLELVDEYGSDSMKFTLAFMCAQGQDVLVDKESFKLGSKFSNKIWNASRYILMNLEGRNLIKNPRVTAVDKWIYSRLNTAAKNIQESFLSYRYNEAALTAYEFFWNDFCDWYVEATKLSMKGIDDSNTINAEKDRAATILLDVLEKSLRLLHPLLPFITEEIYQKLPIENKTQLLINARYPLYDEKNYNAQEEKDFASLQSLVGMVRTLRSECGITPDKKLRVTINASKENEKPFKENEGLIKLLAGIGDFSIGDLTIESSNAKPSGSIGMAGAGFEVFVFIAEAVDTAALKKKFTNDLEKDQKYIESLKAKLDNEQFVKNAPAELVTEQKTKLEEAITRTTKFANYLRDL
ncbi:MAG: class I tRNA ligase family protein, partial [Treponema sp.]|nr:class I tRNA ligase family protein [Treponema sp.]